MSRWPVRILVVLLMLAVAASLPVALAQGGIIQVGENQIGEVAAGGAPASYTLALTQPQVIEIQALAVTQGFAPTLSIYDGAQALLRSEANGGLTSSAQLKGLELNAGAYRIEVGSATGQPGQFVISVQPGPPLAPPVTLALGQPVQGQARASEGPSRYAFAGAPTDVLRLYVLSDTPDAAPSVTLKDATTLAALAFSGAPVANVTYRLLPGPTGFLLEIAAGAAAGDQAFTVCVDAENGVGPLCPGSQPNAVSTPLPGVVATATPVQQLPPLPATGPCVVGSLTGGGVNVRSGPGLGYPPISGISGAMTVPVIGRLANDSWFQVNANGVIGWISTSVVRVGGQCGGVGVVAPPTPAATGTVTATPTITVTPTWTPDGSTTPTWTPTDTPTVTDTWTPTWTPTVTDTWTPTWTPTDTP